MLFGDITIKNLWKSHFGLTKSISEAYQEAACICSSRHHPSPTTCDVLCCNDKTKTIASWEMPTRRMIAALANDNDTTEAAAYGICLVVVGARLNLFAIARAETLTGADYYVAPPGTDIDDLEDKIRLEISGMSQGTENELKARLRRKQEQVRKGISDLPALASVVGFSQAKVFVAEVSLT